MAQEELIDILNENSVSGVEVVRDFRKQIVITGSAIKDFTPVYSQVQMSEILQEEVQIGNREV